MGTLALQMQRPKRKMDLPVNICSFKSNIYFGDSITQGLYGTPPWTTVLSAYLNATEINLGEQGTTMQHRVPYNELASFDMVSRIGEIPVYYASVYGIMVISYAMNDAPISAVFPNYSPQHFTDDARTVIQAAKANGWPANRILIQSLSYMTDAAFAFFENVLGPPPATRSTFTAYIAAARNAAQIEGTLFYDTYTPMSELPYADGYISLDGVHPLTTGHRVIANNLYKYLLTVFSNN